MISDTMLFVYACISNVIILRKILSSRKLLLTSIQSLTTKVQKTSR